MPEGEGPAITRRRLRIELRKMREQAGLSQGEVAAKLDWSVSKLIRIENGSVGVAVTDVRALLGLYQASERTIEDLARLAKTARERRWWSKYRDVVSPHLQEYLGFEADAVRLRLFHPTAVLGLLQTEAYARAMTGSQMFLSAPSESRQETLIQVRIKRQQEILRSGNPPDFTAIIDEGALHRQVGGPDVMRAQLRHLAELQKDGLVSLGIVPYSAGAHFGMFGAFHIFDFADDVEESVLYLEQPYGSISMQDKSDLVAQYEKRFESLLAVSIQGSRASGLLSRLSDEMA